MQRSARLKYIVIWLALGCVAAVVCSLTWPAAHFGNEAVPVGIDSFYHARRILDTAADPASFYEFDPKIHAPEGSLLTWPWGYDYVMGLLVRLAEVVGIPGAPIQILIWIPVTAVFISVGLMMLIARQLSLSLWSTIIAALCVGLSPLTQILHGVGIIDHHFAEYVFILATIGFGLWWFLKAEDVRAAIALGFVIGVAPSVHNGLFILQLPILATILALWLQGIRLPVRTTALFCLALLAATVAILIPSLPLRLGQFEFYTLSWFHLYVACGTVLAASLFARLPRTTPNIAVLLLAAVVLLIPLSRQILVAQSFLVGATTRLDVIMEMRSVRQMAFKPDGLMTVSKLYSLLIWLLPMTAAYCLFRCWRERGSGRLFFWICSILGLTMLTMQFRLHYFGSFALYLPWLVLTERLVRKHPDRRNQIMLAVSLGLLLTYVLPIRYQLTSVVAPAGDLNFRSLRPILGDLQQACADEPGIVLADNDAGHYIRYYTDCSVIANNFLLTPQHGQKIHQIDYLTSLPAEVLPDVAPYVRYVLLRPATIERTETKEYRYMSFSQQSGQRLLSDLLLQPVDAVPPNYVLLEQASMQPPGEEQSLPYIRLYTVKREVRRGE